MRFTLSIDKKEQARIDVGRCINCGDCQKICPTGAIREYQRDVSGVFLEGELPRRAGCSVACPMGIIPQAVSRLAAEGEIEKAYRHIASRNPMPWVCAQTCGSLCQDFCKLCNLGCDPINTQMIERDIIGKGTPQEYEFNKPVFDKVAIIGGGPAGIMAAFELRRSGYRPVIFERRDRLGGAASWGIPDMRLDKEKYHEEIDHLIETGIEVRYQYIIGENYSIDQIWEEGFAAILIATGASEAEEAPLKGGRVQGVFEAVDLLMETNDGGLSGREQKLGRPSLADMGQRVVLVGSGRLAADAGQILASMGKEVVLVQQSESEDFGIPAQTLEIMRDAGVEIREKTMATQIISDPDGVKAVEIARKGRVTNLFCDAVVYATGTRCSVENICKAQTHPEGNLRIDKAHRTNKEGIYACGDVTGESHFVVEAMAAGRDAARAIDADLRGADAETEKDRYCEAPEGERIYPENVILQRSFEAMGVPGGETLSGDILSLIRAAGIPEEMPVFFADDGPDEEHGYKKVAIIGGGFAGIAAAIALAKQGIRPTILEQTGILGGSCRWLSTNRRFDHDLMRKELEKLEPSGIRVMYNTSGGVRPDVLELLKQYDAVLFAIGETAGKKPDVPGADARGVYDIVTLMDILSSGENPETFGSRIVVVGSDEISVDAARALKRVSDDVTLLADCGKGKLQIKTGAVDLLLEEGINIVTGVGLEEIQVKRGAVSGVSCKVLENGSSLGIPCETVVFGEGKGPDLTTISLKNLYLDLDERGYIKTNSQLAASMRGVFAIGDFNMSSIDAGKAGAAAVCRYLTGSNQAIAVERFRPEEMAIEHERIQAKPVSFTGRTIPVTVAAEAKRCIDCGYHKADESLCIGCGICSMYCPTGAIWMEGVTDAARMAGATNREGEVK